jgi:AraC-like DNA-binding protein
MNYIEHRPCPELASILECLWEASDPHHAPERPPERIVPDGCPELIVHLAHRFSRLVRKRWVTQPRMFIAGTLSRPWTLRGGRGIHTLGIRFRPGSITGLFPISMPAAKDREVPLAGVIGAAPARQLFRRLRSAGSRTRRFEVAEDWLRARLPDRPRPRSSATPAADAIRKSRGRVPVREIARALGWNPRRMERLFRRDLGIRPKLYARIVRLNAVLASLDGRERGLAVDLALEAGYFDQAHLLKDFRHLAGRGPRDPRDADGALARHFTRPERLRALLGE